MKTTLLLIRLSLVVPIMASCAYLRVGDNAIRVQGEVASGLNVTVSCSIELRSHPEGYILHSLPIDQVFDSTLTVSPRRAIYRIAIVCSGYDEIYESEPIEVRDTRYYHSPIDLGRLPLNPKDPAGL